MEWKGQAMAKSKPVRFLKKATAFALSMVVCCGILVQWMPSVTQATSVTESLQQSIEQLKKQNEALNKKINSIEGNISNNKEAQNWVYQKIINTQSLINNLNILINEKEDAIQEKELEITKTQDNIQLLENKIEQNEQLIIQKEAENRSNIQKFGEILNSMYISENKDFISILLGATDWYDLFIRGKLIQGAAEKNVEFMRKLQSDIAALELMIEENEEDKTKFEKTNAVLELQKADLVQQKNELDEQIQEAALLLDGFNSEYYKYESFLKELDKEKNAILYQKQKNEKEIEEYEKQIERIIRESQLGGEYISGAFLWPVDSKYNLITTRFGYDAWRKGNHYGIDIGNSGIGGANIYAAKSGTVIKAFTNDVKGYSYGKYVVIDHGGGVATLYAHCSTLFVVEGQKVNQGDVIALVGSTGWSTGNHLHFEIRVNGTATNPLSSNYEYINKPALRYW